MPLTLAEANTIIAGAIAKAEELNIKISVAVVDTGGRPLAFARMDGARWAGAYGSQGKAAASAAFGVPSGNLTERADHPTFRGIVAASGGQMFLGQGGVAVIRDGEILGGVGVGGGTGQQDEDCAQAGVDTL